jgi:hypothetical protein
MHRTRALLAAGGLVTLFASCASYFPDRWRDLRDIGGVRLVAGGGGRVGLGIGPYRSPITFGWYDYRKYGWDGRAVGAWDESGSDLVTPVKYRLEAVGGNEYATELVDELDRIDEGLEKGSDKSGYPRNTFNNIDEIQLTAVPLFAGLEVNVSPLQIFDFIFGWLTIDVAKDDVGGREEMEERPGAAPARKLAKVFVFP